MGKKEELIKRILGLDEEQEPKVDPYRVHVEKPRDKNGNKNDKRRLWQGGNEVVDVDPGEGFKDKQ